MAGGMVRSVRAADTVVLQAYKSICARARLQLVALGIGEPAQGMTRRQHTLQHADALRTCLGQNQRLKRRL